MFRAPVLQTLSVWKSLKFVVWKRVKRYALLHNLGTSVRLLCKLFTTQSQLLTTLRKKPDENIMGKGENADNQHFLLFSQCFLFYQRHKSSFKQHLICHLQMV